jgi:hypothetical protein
MVLHVTFSDGSNPWISLPGDRKIIAKLWRRWMKYHPDTAEPVVIAGPYRCQKSRWHAGYYLTARNGQHIPRQYYQTLGHALRALERLEEG